MGELTFIGMGLYSEADISLKGLRKAKEADAVFAEFYTSLMLGLSQQKLRELVGKRIRVIFEARLGRRRGQNDT